MTTNNIDWNRVKKVKFNDDGDVIEAEFFRRDSGMPPRSISSLEEPATPSGRELEMGMQMEKERQALIEQYNLEQVAAFDRANRESKGVTDDDILMNPMAGLDI